ncbi:hypothetical protein Hanom_Chr00s001158g01675181 [Helianthus anomalus]
MYHLIQSWFWQIERKKRMTTRVSAIIFVAEISFKSISQLLINYNAMMITLYSSQHKSHISFCCFLYCF